MAWLLWKGGGVHAPTADVRLGGAGCGRCVSAMFLLFMMVCASFCVPIRGVNVGSEWSDATILANVDVADYDSATNRSDVYGITRHVDGFIIVWTDFSIMLFDEDLVFVDKIGITPLDQYRIRGVSFVEGSTGWVATKNFIFCEFWGNASTLELGPCRTLTDDYEKGDQPTCSGYYDYYKYPFQYLTYMQADDDGYLLLVTSTSTRWRVFAYDTKRRFPETGVDLMFRMAPSRPCFYYVVEFDRMHTMSNVTYVFGSQYALFLKFVAGEAWYNPDMGPGGTGRWYPMSYEKIYSGLAYSADSDVVFDLEDPNNITSHTALEVAGSVFVVGVPMASPLFDNIQLTLFTLEQSTSSRFVNRLTAIVADPQQNYIYAGDGLGAIFRLRFDDFVHSNWTYSVAGVIGISDPGIKFLSFGDSSLKLFATVDNHILSISTQNCSAFSWCSECISAGGLYCFWNSTSFACESSDLVEHKQECEDLFVYPLSVYRSGGEIVTAEGEFVTEYDWGIQFSSDDGQVVVVNNTQMQGTNKIKCIAPALTTTYGMDVWVMPVVWTPGTTLDSPKTYQKEGVKIRYYSCEVSVGIECISTALPRCGVCVAESRCTELGECSVASSFDNSSDCLPVVSGVVPSNGPHDRNTPIVVDLAAQPGLNNTYNLTQITTWNTMWCAFSFAPPAIDARVRAVVISEENAQIGCPVPPDLAPSAVMGTVHVGAADMVLSTQPGQFQYFDCEDQTDCSSCIDQSPCRWCLHQGRCIGNGSRCQEDCVLGGNETCIVVTNSTSCPFLFEVVPHQVPYQGGLQVSLVVQLGVENVSLVMFNQSAFECQWEIGGYVIGRTAAHPQSAYDLTCFSAALNDSIGTVDVRAFYENAPYTPHAKQVQTMDCDAGDCISCQNKENCGWCVETSTCTGRGMCEPPLSFLDVFCPSLSALAPFEGAATGDTIVNVAGSHFFEGGDFCCRFLQGNGSVIVRNASVIDTVPPLVQCQSPGGADGFVRLDVAEYRGNDATLFASNSLSFVYLECGVFNGSCSSCLVPAKADCGWCLTSGRCSGRSECMKDPEAVWLSECLEVSVVDTVSRLRRGEWVTIGISNPPSGMVPSVRLRALGAVDPLLWTCRWNGGASTTDAAFDESTQTISCEADTEGSLALEIMYNGKVVSESELSVTVIDARERRAKSWGSVGGVFAVILLAFSCCALSALGCVSTIGLPTPIIRHANYLFVSALFHGAYLALLSGFFFIGEETKGICRARVWFACASSVCFAGPLFAHTLHKVRHVNSNRKRFRRVPTCSILALTSMFATWDFLVNVIWVSADPRDAVWEEQGDWTLVKRCKSDHDSVWMSLVFVPKFLLLIFFCLVELASKHLQSSFKESRYVSWAYLNALLLSAVCLPLIFFSHMDERALSFFGVLYIVLLSMGTMFLIFTPKIYILVLRRHKNKTPEAPPDRRALLKTRLSSSAMGDDEQSKVSLSGMESGQGATAIETVEEGEDNEMRAVLEGDSSDDDMVDGSGSEDEELLEDEHEESGFVEDEQDEEAEEESAKEPEIELDSAGILQLSVLDPAGQGGAVDAEKLTFV